MVTHIVPKAAAGLLALVLPAFALASDGPLYTREFDRCAEASGGVTLEMLNCIASEHERADKRLNAAYKALLRREPSRKAGLTAAQRAWLAFREANCDYYADPNGGTMVQVVVNDCFLRMTAERADELEMLAKPQP